MTATPTPENYGTGHRCRNCGERIDVQPAKPGSSEGVWVHDRNGSNYCRGEIGYAEDNGDGFGFEGFDNVAEPCMLCTQGKCIAHETIDAMSTMAEERLAGRLVAVSALEAGLKGGTVQELIAGATAQELRFAVAMLTGLYAQTLQQRCPNDWPRLIEALRQHIHASI